MCGAFDLLFLWGHAQDFQSSVGPTSRADDIEAAPRRPHPFDGNGEPNDH